MTETDNVDELAEIEPIAVKLATLARAEI